MSRPIMLAALVVTLVAAAPAAADNPRPELADRIAKLPDELLKAKKADAELVDGLFLAVFVRLPSDKEREVATKHLAGAKSRERGVQDLVWAAVNTKEFLKLHGLDGDLHGALQFTNGISAAWEKARK